MEKKERLYSLDVLRGLDMLLLTAVGPILHAIQRGWHCFPEGVMGQLRHGWVCFTLWDIIMPLFIFMCGAAIPFALGRRLEAGNREFWKHVLFRAAMLWFMGGCVQGNWAALNPQTFGPYANTLQAIAAGYLAVAVTMSFRRRWLMFAVPLALAAVYTVILAVGGDYGQFSNAAFKVDQAVFRALLPATNEYVARPGHFEGVHFYTWILTSCMFAAMTFCGYHATKIVLTDWSKRRKILGLLGFAAALFAVGFLSELWIPCIKPIYTLSFTAQAMGWCVLSLAVLYFVHDVLMFRKGLWLVLLYGQCALTVYFVRGFFGKALSAVAHACGDGIAAHLPKASQDLFMTLLTIAIVVLVATARRRLRKS